MNSINSLSVSTKSTLKDPKEELKAGLFDLDRSHLKEVDPFFDTGSPEHEVD